MTADRLPALSLLPRGPLYDGYFADPFCFWHQGLYYAYGTGSIINGRAFEVLTSPDLRRWVSLGGALEIGSEARDYWAPEVASCADKFYLYYSVGQGDKGHHLRVACANTPRGPFIDMGIDLTPHESFAIDPHPLRAANGQWYLYFARDDLSGSRPGTVLAAAELRNMTQLGPVTTLLRASADWQRYQAGREMYGSVYDWHTLEGPFAFERGAHVHLLYSGGAWTGAQYGVGYAVATHPLGPFHEPAPGPAVLSSSSDLIGPGHASVTQQGGQDILVFHAWNTQGDKRQLHAAPLHWSAGYPLAVPTAAPT